MEDIDDDSDDESFPGPKNSVVPALCLKLCSVLATSLFSDGKKSPLGGSRMVTRHAPGFVAGPKT